jgi:hypothetical protein
LLLFNWGFYRYMLAHDYFESKRVVTTVGNTTSDLVFVLPIRVGIRESSSVAANLRVNLLCMSVGQDEFFWSR